MKYWLLVIVFLFSSSLARGQAGQATEIKAGPTNPTTCNVARGWLFFNTVSAAMQFCSATNTWSSVGGTTLAFSALTAGANTNTGLFSMSQAGTFTNAAQNETFQLTLGASCPQSTIIGGTTKVTDAFSSCLNVPSGASVTNGFSNAVGAYAVNNNSSQLGAFGDAIAVGVFGAAYCNASNSKCEGISPQVSDAGSLSGVLLEGVEVGVVPFNTTDVGYGILLSFEGGTHQPTGDNMPAVYIQPPTGGATWTSGFESGDFSNSSSIGLYIGKFATGAAQQSQIIKFSATNAASSTISSSFALLPDNVQALGAGTIGFAVNNASGEETYGVMLTATAALAHDTLVKIDTAHADSVVICTTADTSCDGFVQGTNGTNGLCTIGSTICAIVTTPGSKVKGIIGTSTCAIGNFVIVDTTTNGDIQCTGTPPTIGKEIGKALSACAAACAGTTIDVLTKFE